MIMKFDNLLNLYFQCLFKIYLSFFLVNSSHHINQLTLHFIFQNSAWNPEKFPQPLPLKNNRLISRQIIQI